MCQFIINCGFVYQEKNAAEQGQQDIPVLSDKHFQWFAWFKYFRDGGRMFAGTGLELHDQENITGQY